MSKRNGFPRDGHGRWPALLDHRVHLRQHPLEVWQRTGVVARPAVLQLDQGRARAGRLAFPVELSEVASEAPPPLFQ